MYVSGAPFLIHSGSRLSTHVDPRMKYFPHHDQVFHPQVFGRAVRRSRIVRHYYFFGVIFIFTGLTVDWVSRLRKTLCP